MFVAQALSLNGGESLPISVVVWVERHGRGGVDEAHVERLGRQPPKAVHPTKLTGLAHTLSALFRRRSSKSRLRRCIVVSD